MNRTARFALPTVLLAAGVALSACGSSSGTTSSAMPKASTAASSAAQPAAGNHNAADVTFATAMIPHHAQAIVMSDMAAKQATNGQVKTLAAQIKAAQTPEITMMMGWLKVWGAPVADPATDGMAGMGDAGDMGATMMSAQDMSNLAKATGVAFDRMWLQLMTKHHQGAITMAKTELSAGSYAEAKTLAQNIIAGQSGEITAMAALLKTLG